MNSLSFPGLGNSNMDISTFLASIGLALAGLGDPMLLLGMRHGEIRRGVKVGVAGGGLPWSRIRLLL